MKRKVLALTIVLVIFMQVTSVAFATDNTGILFRRDYLHRGIVTINYCRF
jgi:hypothetical protein